MAFRLKAESELCSMAQAGGRVWCVLTEARDSILSGMSTLEIERVIRTGLGASDLQSSMLGVVHRATGAAFPGVCSVSINEEACHAPPSERVVMPGDLVTVDLAASLEGWHADAAISLVVPRGDAATLLQHQALAGAADRVTRAAISAMKPNGLWSEAAQAARQCAAKLGVSILPGFGGHGIGRDLHEHPQARFDAVRGSNHDFQLAPGTVITVEPIVTASPVSSRVEQAQWVVRTDSGEPAACEERTVAIWDGAARVLTGPGAEFSWGAMAHEKRK